MPPSAPSRRKKPRPEAEPAVGSDPFTEAAQTAAVGEIDSDRGPSSAAPATTPPSEVSVPSAPSAGRAFSNVELARLAVRAALEVAGVSQVACGPGQEATTYGLPGQALRGIRVTQTQGRAVVEIHLTVLPVAIPPVVAQVRYAVATAIGVCLPCEHVDVFVDAVEFEDTVGNPESVSSGEGKG